MERVYNIRYKVSSINKAGKFSLPVLSKKKTPVQTCNLGVFGWEKVIEIHFGDQLLIINV